MASCTGKVTRDVLERLAYNKDLTEDDLARIRGQEGAEGQARDILAAEPVTVMKTAGRMMAVYDTSSLPGVYLGRQVFAHHGVEFSLIRISERKWQLACNPSVRIDMSELFGQHEAEGLAIRVGGLPKRLLNIKIGRRSPMPANAHDMIVAWVAPRL